MQMRLRWMQLWSRNCTVSHKQAKTLLNSLLNRSCRFPLLLAHFARASFCNALSNDVTAPVSNERTNEKHERATRQVGDEWTRRRAAESELANVTCFRRPQRLTMCASQAACEFTEWAACARPRNEVRISLRCAAANSAAYCCSTACQLTVFVIPYWLDWLTRLPTLRSPLRRV